MSSIEWETPQDFFNALDEEFHFTLDACASPSNAKCFDYYDKNHDALSRHWKRGIIWMNPPYDKSIGKWVQKAFEEAQRGSLIVALVQGRSNDTIWWHKYVMRASEIRFIKNRLHFGLNGEFQRANISSVVVIFRPYCIGPPRVSSIDIKGNKLF